MITVSVATKASFGRITTIGSAGVMPPYGDAYSCVLGVYDGASSASTSSLPILGDFLSQGNVAYGKMRDKAVTHSKADGAIFITPSPLKASSSGRLGLFRNGALLTYMDTLSVSDISSMTSAARPPFKGSGSFGGYTGWIVEAGSRTATISFDGQHLVTTKVTRPAIDIWSSSSMDAKLLASFPSESTVSYMWAVRDPQHNDQWVFTGKTASHDINYVMTSADWLELQKITMWSPAASWVTYDSATTCDPEAVAQFLQQGLTLRIMNLCGVEHHPLDLGELSVQAAKGCSYVDRNILLILQDVANLAENPESITRLVDCDEFKAVKKAYLAFREGSVSLRALKSVLQKFSTVFLTWHYAISPNANDLSEIGKGLNEALFGEKINRVHAMGGSSIPVGTHTVSYQAHLTAEVQTVSQRDWGLIREGIYLGKRWGGYPELQNLWDILMYSFIVDWFVQYGDFFKGIDDFLRVENYFPVDHYVCSEKWECFVPATELVPEALAPWTSGVVKLSHYSRWVGLGNSLPTPKVSLTVSTTLSNHWVETGCLVAQRL